MHSAPLPPSPIKINMDSTNSPSSNRSEKDSNTQKVALNTVYDKNQANDEIHDIVAAKDREYYY